MPALKGHRRSWSKKPKPNPYAQRGLDQFRLLSAELQAAREILVAQLGTPLSLVRFTIGSDRSKWIPIIVAPTLSKAETRALRRAASDLTTGGKQYAFDAGNFQHHIDPVAGGSYSETSKSMIGEHDTHVGFGISEDNLAHDGSTISEVSIKSNSVDDVGPNAISKHDNQTKTLGYLMAATQGFLWMVSITTFSFRIIADILWSGWHTDGVTVRTLPSSSRKDENAIIDHPSADMASSSQPSSHARPPTSITRKDIKTVLPPLPPHDVEAPKMHTRSKDCKLLSAPCSPRGSRQLTKPLSASVSLPKTVGFHGGQAPQGDIKENNQAQKTIPNKVLKSSSSLVDATTSYPQKLGQALSAAGVVLVLGGLVMGYIPSIVSVVCWWYVLPRMRKVVGDKPFVRSHHHHHSSQEHKSNVNKAIGTGAVVSSGKDHLPYHENKKKVIMDGLLERQQHHSHA